MNSSQTLLTDKKRNVLFALIAFFAMLIYSQNSPLYYTNDWVDSNYYLTMGQGIIHGLVPYKDLFEQKGPILYFIHALATAVTGRNFYGIYVIESLLLLGSLILFYKTCRFFISEKYAFMASAFLPVLMLQANGFLTSGNWFQNGDSAEEFAFPAIMFLIYSIFKYCKAGKMEFPPKIIYLLGLFMGYIFWIKYTMTGGFLAFFLFLGIYLLITKKWLEFLKTLGLSLAGFLTVSVPVLLYFGLNNGINALIEDYFKINMTTYSSATTFISHFSFLGSFFVQGFISSIWLIVPFGFLIAFLVKRKDIITSDVLQSSLFTVVFLATALFAFWGEKPWLYYYLVLIPFFAIGFLGIFELLQSSELKEQKYKKVKQIRALKKGQVALFTILAILLPLSGNATIKTSRIFVKTNHTA